MRNLIIITILFFKTICQAQVPIGDDELSEIWRCTSHDPEEEATDDYYPPDFRAGLLYYKILSQYSDTIVEVYWPACECDEDANYSQLDTCIVPERVIYKDKSYTVKGIGFCAFRRCMKKLRKVILPNTITYIAQGAFNECDSLTNINIPASLKRVGPPDAFMTPYIYRIYKQLPDSIEYVWGVNINPW